jgi:hypothetical protein
MLLMPGWAFLAFKLLRAVDLRADLAHRLPIPRFHVRDPFAFCKPESPLPSWTRLG